MPTLTAPSLTQIRAEFPMLASPTIFLENAGGSLLPRVVIEAMTRYLSEAYVNYGAAYPESEAATETIHEAHTFARTLMNGDGIGEVVLGASSSQLLRMLADAYLDILKPGDEIIIAETGHEANYGPWARLAKYGIVIRSWPISAETWDCPMETLAALLNERTKLVAFPHVSNVLGKVVDVAAITAMAHSRGAQVVVDGVAYASHAAVDVAAWGCDWYAYSTYKVYGPHMGCLFGTHAAMAGLVGPNHFFVPSEEVPRKFELGNLNHEGCAGIVALGDYFAFLAGADIVDRTTIERAYARMHELEAPLIERLLGYLREKPGVRIIGPDLPGPDRVGTIAFVREGKSSADIAAHALAHRIGIRNGHMYAYRLVEALGLPVSDGVVRVSLVHYNSMEEIERLIAVLDAVL